MNLARQLADAAKERRRRMGFVETKPLVAFVTRNINIELKKEQKQEQRQEQSNPIYIQCRKRDHERRRCEERKIQRLISRQRREEEIRIALEITTKCVAEHFNITADKLRGHSRPAGMIFARFIAFHICNRSFGISYKKTGSYFNRDHTTIIYGVNQIDSMFVENPFLSLSQTIILSRIRSLLSIEDKTYWGA